MSGTGDGKGQPSADGHGRLTRQLVVRVDERLYRALVADARRAGESMGERVRWHLRRALL